MKTSLPNTTYVLPRWLRGWEQFWFTPADPALLAVMRICCGLVVLYTFFAYSFKLQEFMGENAWNNLQYRLDVVRDRPVNAAPLDGVDYAPPPRPVNDFQIEYHDTYLRKWGFLPPPPYPKNRDEADQLDEFQVATGYDLRRFGLPIPRDEKQWEYARRYTKAWGLPPPAYPADRGRRHGHRGIYAARRAGPAQALRARHARLLALFPRHRSQRHGGHPRPDRPQRLPVHHRLLHAIDLGVHLVRLAVLHPPQSDRPGRLPASTR